MDKEKVSEMLIILKILKGICKGMTAFFAVLWLIMIGEILNYDYYYYIVLGLHNIVPFEVLESIFNSYFIGMIISGILLTVFSNAISQVINRYMKE